MSKHGLTSEQAAVFAGHTQVLSYPIRDAQGDRLVYRCESLGLTRSVLLPSKRSRHGNQKVTAQPVTVWFLDDAPTTYRSLADVADAIMDKRKAAQRAQEQAKRLQDAVLIDSRCDDSPILASG